MKQQSLRDTGRRIAAGLHALRVEGPFLAPLLVIAIGVFLVLTIRSGSPWDGDDALYIMDARNIVLGLPYAHTNYVLNPANVINPAAYPPGLPLLLAPIYWWSGVNLVQMKILCIACFVVFLAVFARIARGYIGAGLALLTVAALGLHPFIWNSKDTVASEFPFMLFCYSGLWLVDRLQRQSTSTRRLELIGAALIIAFACLVRSIGVVIFPAAFFSSILRSRRLVNLTLAALVLAAVIVAAIHEIFPADVGAYLGYFHGYTLSAIVERVEHYARVGGSLFGAPVARVVVLAALIGAVFSALVIVGFVRRVRRQITVFEWFFLGYGAVLLIYPVSLEPSRYSLPLWPLLFLYCAVGIESVMRRLERDMYRVIALIACAGLAAIYIAQYATLGTGPISHSIDAAPSRALFAAIRRDVPVTETVLARKPTEVALYSQRPATTWGQNFSDAELWGYIARTHVQFIVQERFPVTERHEHPNAPLNAFILRNRTVLAPIFRNNWFVLYRISASAHAKALQTLLQ